MRNKYDVLREYFGYSSFRNGQEELIDGITSGRDVLGIMPTGGGKSICYQVPALMMNGITIVISPLISLMKDQVMALKTAGVPAAFINSSLTPMQMGTVYRNLEAGMYKLVYVAPERLETEEFLALASRLPISLVAVDEAHCISQWGQDFRPSYLKIVSFLSALPRRPVLAAFTATATEVVRRDIVRILELRSPIRVITGFDRPNLNFEVIQPPEKMKALEDYLAAREGKSGIVYCMTRREVERICDSLARKGLPVTRYHAGLGDGERQRNQEDFIYDRKPIMVATTAFGMGIDKSNVNFVVHYNLPLSLEAYYQEAGRAGRDGEPADCLLMFARSDLPVARQLLFSSTENEAMTEEEKKTVFHQNQKRFTQMIGYCRTTRCLRGYILEYFGQPHAERCENCGNCRAVFVEEDITIDAQKILSCVKRAYDHLGHSVGKLLIIRILRGSTDQRLRELGLDRLSTYGLMREVGQNRVSEMIDHLEAIGALVINEQHGGVMLTPGANGILFRGEKVMASFKTEPESKSKTKKSKRQKESAVALVGDEKLYEQLKALRLRLAEEERVPAYVIFANKSLSEMAAKKPMTHEDFLEISGVGQTKAERYGSVFLKAISDFVQSSDG